jgi:acetyl-CoA acetyltransferase
VTSPVFVAGVGTTRFGKFPGRPLESLGSEAILAALDDAGVEGKSVQALYAGHARTGQTSGRENGVGQLVAGAAGIVGIPVLGVGNFCASGSTAFREAFIAVTSGLYDVVLAIGIEKLSTRADRGQPLTSDGVGFLSLFGFTPPAYFAMAAKRYMAATGATVTDFASVAVKNRAHAAFNPNAQYRDPVTVEQVLGSAVVAEPLTVLSCCPTGDGAAAAVLVSESVARRMGSGRLVRIRGSSLTSASYQIEDLSSFDIDRRAASAAYGMAGIDPSDIDVVELHDAFTATELIHYEDLFLTERGGGVALLSDGATALGGRVPVNPSGGLLSRGHPLGATGLAQVHEIVTQLRAEASARQVEGARIGITHCVGGFVDGQVASSSVHVLESPARQDGRGVERGASTA